MAAVMLSVLWLIAERGVASEQRFCVTLECTCAGERSPTGPEEQHARMDPADGFLIFICLTLTAAARQWTWT